MSLTVCIPVYNCGNYIAETIESVLSQKTSSINVVVVDNCSTDNTKEVVSNYLSRGIHYIKHESNIGGINNHNFCLNVADTEYLKLLSADDVLLPGMLNRQLNLLHANPDCNMATCNYLVTDESLNVIKRVQNLSGKTLGKNAIAICAAKVANLIGNPSSIMIRVSSIGINRFESKYKWYGDLRFFCSILDGSNMINSDEDGLLYRRHDSSDSNVTCFPFIRLKDELDFVNEFAKFKLEPNLRLLKRYKYAYLEHILK